MREHDWNVSPKEAVELQKRLRADVLIAPLARTPKTIAGADVSLERFGTDLYAGIIVMSYPDLKPLCHSVVKLKVAFPYIPGLLSFREIPGLLECLGKLPIKPDLIVVDGQGIAHPRGMGIAVHLGALTGMPTIGCAKSRLYGTYREPKAVGQVEPIHDPNTGALLGYALKSKARSNPLMVSPGNSIDADGSLAIVRSCLRGYRLPEPTRRAHLLVNAFRRGEIESGAKLY